MIQLRVNLEKWPSLIEFIILSVTIFLLFSIRVRLDSTNARLGLSQMTNSRLKLTITKIEASENSAHDL